MEPALRAVCKDVRIGTILIQTNCNTGEPEVKPWEAEGVSRGRGGRGYFLRALQPPKSWSWRGVSAQKVV